MRARTILIATAIVSSILGAVVSYLVLTVPNDIYAGGLMDQARANMKVGKTREAREALTKIVQQYPRTDAAAAATVALVRLEQEERTRVAADLARLRTETAAEKKRIDDLSKTVAQLAAPKPAPPPPPPVVTKAPAKKPPAKKAPTKKRTPTKKRRR